MACYIDVVKVISTQKKQMILLLVGPDMCAKSNIANALSIIYDVPVYKANSEHTAFLKNQDRFINDLRFADPARLDLIKQLNVDIIFDRGYPCELVYSTFFERRTDAHMLTYLDDEYSKLDAKIIFCTRKSFNGICDDLNPNLDSDALSRLSLLYVQFLEQTKCKHTTLYVDDYDLKRQIIDITKFLGHKCSEVISNTFVMCGEHNNYCSDVCYKIAQIHS